MRFTAFSTSARSASPRAGPAMPPQSNCNNRTHDGISDQLPSVLASPFSLHKDA